MEYFKSYNYFNLCIKTLVQKFSWHTSLYIYELDFYQNNATRIKVATEFPNWGHDSEFGKYCISYNHFKSFPQNPSIIKNGNIEKHMEEGVAMLKNIKMEEN